MIFGFESGAARRWAELVTKLFGFESGDAPLPPGFILELERPEWAFLKREFFWTTGPITVAANATNISRLQIHNPSGSGRIVVVEGFVVLNSAVSLVYAVVVDSPIAGTPTANIAIDSRVLTGAGSRKVTSLNRIDNNTLPSLGGLQRLDERTASVGGGASQDVIFNFRTGPLRPIMLSQNNVCEIACTTINTPLRAIGYGYEHVITPDELAA